VRSGEDQTQEGYRARRWIMEKHAFVK
jgi:hypothetical protein